jgi:hypothetical protein
MAEQGQAVPRTTTLGMDRVRMTFNPSNNFHVDNIKGRTADLIDLCSDIKAASSNSETARLCSLAQTAYEEAAMWAVKAATADDVVGLASQGGRPQPGPAQSGPANT